MGWPFWLLLGALVFGALLLLALYLIRFRYHYDYAFPHSRQGAVTLSFLGWKRQIRLGEEGEGSQASPADADRPQASRSDGNAATEARPGTPGPRPGQEGFLAVPFRDRLATWKGRLKYAGLKCALDLPVWGHLTVHALRSGLRALRMVGPSLERLHLASSDVVNLGRFAAFWSALAGLAPFLASPVEYRFAQPFALRFRVSGRCTGLGFLLFVLAVLFTLPWLRLIGRFRYCWRHPRLNRWQRKVAAAIG
jgi:hypothetical protein